MTQSGTGAGRMGMEQSTWAHAQSRSVPFRAKVRQNLENYYALYSFVVVLQSTNIMTEKSHLDGFW